MEFICSSNNEPNMGYMITHGCVTLDLTINDEVLAYPFSFWQKLFEYITDDMYCDPLPNKALKQLYRNLQTTDDDFTVIIEWNRRIKRVGKKIHFKW